MIFLITCPPTFVWPALPIIYEQRNMTEKAYPRHSRKQADTPSGFLCRGITKMRSLTTPGTYHFRCTARRAAERQYIQFH